MQVAKTVTCTAGPGRACLLVVERVHKIIRVVAPIPGCATPYSHPQVAGSDLYI